MCTYIGPRLKSENYTFNYYRKKVLQFRPQDIRKSLIISNIFLQYFCKMFCSIGFSFVTTFYRFLSGGGKICWLLPPIFPPSNFFKFPPAGIHNCQKESTTSLNWSFWRQKTFSALESTFFPQYFLSSKWQLHSRSIFWMPMLALRDFFTVFE